MGLSLFSRACRLTAPGLANRLCSGLGAGAGALAATGMVLLWLTWAKKAATVLPLGAGAATGLSSGG